MRRVKRSAEQATVPYRGAAPFVKGSKTSEDAAESIDAAALREKVYERVAAEVSNGMTCDEVEKELGLRHQTASARIRELVLGSRLWDSGETRSTESGRQATVWTAHQTEEKPESEARTEVKRIVLQELDALTAKYSPTDGVLHRTVHRVFKNFRAKVAIQ